MKKNGGQGQEKGTAPCLNTARTRCVDSERSNPSCSPSDGTGDKETCSHDKDEQSSHHSAEQQRDAEDLQLSRTKSLASSMSKTREFFFIGLLCSCQLVTQAGLLNTLNILHIIGPDLGISNPGVLSWLVAGYSLSVGTFILLFGRFGDIYGFKQMIVIGFAWFAVWNVIAGCSVYVHGFGAQFLFIWSRVMAGIGPAILIPNALGMLGKTYDDGMKKNLIFSLFGACAPSGAVLGGTFAGLWSLVWWPWTFWTFGITMFSLAVLSIIILPSVPLDKDIQHMSLKEKILELDLPGATAGITALILFNFAWNQAAGFTWHHPYIYVSLIIGVLLVPVFFWIEMKVAKSPLIPFNALSVDTGFVLTCIVCGWASFGIFIYYLVQFLQEFRHISPLLTVAQLSPVAISGTVAAFATAFLMPRVGPAWVMLISMCGFLIGNIIFTTMPIHQTYWAQTFVVTLIITFGMDMSFPAGTLILSNSVEKKHQGMAASLIGTVVNYSISLGVGIAGTVEVQNLHGKSIAAMLHAYRCSEYLAIGFSGLGILTSIVLIVKTTLKNNHEQSEDKK